MLWMPPTLTDVMLTVADPNEAVTYFARSGQSQDPDPH